VKYLSVCSGIEAASKAWEPIGWKPVAFSEIEPFPSAVLKHHWPEVPNLGDMSKYEQWNIPSGSVDILVGGTPCQSFSVAGLRQGLKDPRGNLMLTYLAIAERLKPRWLVWENVPGVLSSNGGKDFGSFLGALGELGYEWAYRVLDAQWFGVAQRRRRVFVVAHLGKGNLAAKVLFESESVRRDTPPSREARKAIASNVAPSLTASNDPSRSPQSSEVTQQVNAVLEAGAFRMQAFGEYSDDGTASAMKARDYKDATDLVASPVVIDRVAVAVDCYNKTIGEKSQSISSSASDINYTGGVINPADRMAVRRLSPRECERLQGFPDDHTLIPWRNKPADQCPDGPRYKALGNSMAVPCMAWIGKRIDAVERKTK
jgi:DNA (cytosine-5)-methyltransferase 1